MPEARRAPVRRRARLSGPVGWALLAIGVAAVLCIGAFRPHPPGRAERISHLESVIKCPACADVSIAQSSAPSAVALRARVTALVDRGWSDRAIEAWVNGRFGANEILSPSSSGFDSLAWIVPLAGLGVAGAGLGVVFVRRRRSGPGPGPDERDEALVAAALAAPPPGAPEEVGAR